MLSVGQKIPMLSEEQSISAGIFLWVGMKCKDNWLAPLFCKDFLFWMLYAQVCRIGMCSAGVFFPHLRGGGNNCNP